MHVDDRAVRHAHALDMDCGLVAGAHRQMLMMLINTSVWTGVCHNDFPIPMRTCGSMIIGARTCVHMAGAKQLDEYEHAWRHLSPTGAGRHERRMRQTARGLLMQELLLVRDSRTLHIAITRDLLAGTSCIVQQTSGSTMHGDIWHWECTLWHRGCHQSTRQHEYIGNWCH